MLKYKEFLKEGINNEKFKDINEIFKEESGFDKRKKINRSEKEVSLKDLNNIEDGINIEELEKLNLPIFKYRTQITIHGNFDVTSHRISGYKMIFQNKNKSLGVKWNAIDFKKKKYIYNKLKKIGYSVKLDSSSYYAQKVLDFNEENYNKLIKEYKDINDNLIVGTKEIFKASIPLIGTYIVLRINIRSIREDNINKFLESFDITEEKIKKFEEEDRIKKQEQEEYYNELKNRNEENRKLRKIEQDKKIKEFFDKYEKINSIDDIPESDSIMLYFKNDRELLIKKYTKNGVDKYQRMAYDNYKKGADKESINKRLRKYDITEELVEKIINNFDVFLIKSFKEENKKIKDFSKFEETSSNIKIVDYSEKSVAIFGETYPIKDKLKKLGARFNRFLINPETEKKEPGWIISKNKKDELKKII